MDDEQAMLRAVELADGVRGTTSPNPWVGAVLDDGVELFEGATAPPGGAHAEVRALERAGRRARGATLYVTLEPCAHEGRTGPCADAIVDAGVSRVVVGVRDPDPRVSGRGIARLRHAGVRVDEGVAAREVGEQLAPYFKHRTTGRPFVILKLAVTLDGRTAAPDGTSRWITGSEARQDVHGLRGASDAVLVGAGTVRADDPELTARQPAEGGGPARQPLRVVLGPIPAGARVLPAESMGGNLEEVLDDLGSRGVVQLLVEGGPSVARDFHAAGLVDRYVLYLAPVLLGGDDGRPVLAGPGAASIGDAWRGEIVSVRRVGADLRVELAAGGATDTGRSPPSEEETRCSRG